MIDVPIRFPKDADVIAEEAARFRAMSPQERMRVIEDMIDTGERLIRISPNADFIERYSLEQEELARQAFKEFVARYG